MVHNEVMTHNTPEEKSPAKTADVPETQWQEDPLPDRFRFRSGWSLITALLLGAGIMIGQLMTDSILLTHMITGMDHLLGGVISIIALLGGGIAILLSYYGWLRLGKITAILALIMMGIGVMIYDRLSLPSPVMLPDQPQMVTLIITESQRYRNDRQQIKAHLIPDDPLHKITGNHLIRLIVPSDIKPLYPGYQITAEVDFQPLLPQLLPGGFDFTEHALRQHIIAGGFVRSVKAIDDKGTYHFARMRRAFQEKLFAAMDKDWAAPIASALLPGLRASIPSDLRESWRGAGLAHLLAISGLHMMLVCGIIMVLVRVVMGLNPVFASRVSSFRVSAMTALPLCLFYLIFAGVPVSALRAFIMLGLALVAVFMSRRGITLHHVAVAAIIILIFSPSSLFGPAFQMSFSAVFALVVAWNLWLKRQVPKPRAWYQRLWSYFMAIALSSMIASLASMPFALYHFGITTSWSVLANMIGMPLMGLLIMPMGVASLVLSPVGAESIPLFFMNAGIISLSYIAEYISSWDGARLAIFPPSAPVTFLLAVAILTLGIAPGIWRMASVMILIIAGSLWWMEPRPVAGMLLDYGKPVLAVMSADGHVLTSTSKTHGFAVRVLTQPFGRSESIYVRDYLAADNNMDQHGRANVFCQQESCYITTADGQIFAMVWARSDLTTACQKADIVLALVNASYPCRDGSLLLDRDDLVRRGGMLIYGQARGVGDHHSELTIKQVNTAE